MERGERGKREVRGLGEGREREGESESSGVAWRGVAWRGVAWRGVACRVYPPYAPSL